MTLRLPIRFRLLARTCAGLAALATAPALAAQLATPARIGADPLGDAALSSASRMPEAPLGMPGMPGVAPWLAPEIDRIVEDAIAQGAAPGAAVVIGHRGRIVLARGYGKTDRSAKAPAVTDSTVWDLASVTKVVGTTLGAMLLVQDGALDLDAPVHAYLPEWPSQGARGRITVRELLHHNSGLPPSAPVQRGSREGLIARLAAVGLRGAPGGAELYGDLNMILLGQVIEAIAREPLDRFLARRVYAPLGLRETTFRPLEAGIPSSRIAPTEKLGPVALRGVVHDPIARGLGGVSGNAGLFSSARDVATLASALLWEKPGRIVCRDVADRFTRPIADETYALGWETAAPETSWGAILSRSAYGHTGYTGTSLWIDPERDVFVVLLTNRVNPSARNQRHILLRRELHEAVVRGLIDAAEPPPPAPDGCLDERVLEGFRLATQLRWPR